MPISTYVNDLVVIILPNSHHNVSYIAQITQTKPLLLKVCESGVLANLNQYDCVILEEDTRLLQVDLIDRTVKFWLKIKEDGRCVMSGLKFFGVPKKDNQPQEIFLAKMVFKR